MKKLASLLSALFLLSLNSFSQVNQEWAVTHQDKSSDNDAVTCVDAYGYIYVAGTYESGRTGKDWKIIKYSPAGTDIWIQTYNGTSSGNDFVHAIACDANFNIYVTGSSLGINSNDYTTIKLDNNGNISWTSFYNGSANGSDIAKAIKVDGSGNVYVTGESAGSGTNQDVATVKYTSNGSQSWASRYNSTANSNDVGNAIALDPSNNLIVTGYLTNSGGNKDGLTIKYSNSGSQSWASFFSGTSGFDDFLNAIAVHGDGNIYVTGKTTHSTQSGNYLTIKYGNNGSQKWVAQYNGPAGNEDEASAIVYADGGIYVTGKSKGTTSGATSFDYATIKYNNSGKTQWLVRYNGIGNGDDFASSIIADYTGNIIITGTSQGDTTTLDYTTICYDNASTDLWTKRYTNPSFNGDDYATSLVADLFGNVYVTGSSTGNSSTVDFATVKYADKEKNNIVITDMLQVLAVGLLNESQNDTIKTLVYASCDLCVDSFYHIRYDSLIARAEKLGLPLKTRMNNQIGSYFDLPSADYVGKTLSTLWYRGKLIPALVTVLNYNNFVGTSNINDNPKLTYSNSPDGFPIPCLNCSGTNEVSETDAETILTWIIIVNPFPWIISRDNIFICNCTAELSPFISDRCQVCNPSFPIGGVPQIGTVNLMGIEIKIQVFVNDIGGIAAETPPCLLVNPTGLNGESGGPYALLSYVPGVTYWHRQGFSVVKAPNPIYDRNSDGFNSLKKGRFLSLCTSTTDFNSSDEQPGVRFALAMGGVYKLTRPGTNQIPLYFAFPYGHKFWYTQGPDMAVRYGDLIPIYPPNFPNICPSGKREINEDYQTPGCEFCSTGYTVFSGLYPTELPTQPDITKYLVSTDANFILDYWRDNAIVVGFTNDGAGPTAESNIYEFLASTNPQSCNPSSYNLDLSYNGPICSLILQPTGEYNVQGTFIDNSNSPIVFPVGTNFLIHVQAKFSNGELIDQCLAVTLNPTLVNPSLYPFDFTQVNIRGNINDYDINNPTIIQYQVDIYKLQ